MKKDRCFLILKIAILTILLLACTLAFIFSFIFFLPLKSMLRFLLFSISIVASSGSFVSFWHNLFFSINTLSETQKE